ncbi:MAG: hypothetical protein ACXWU8_06920, partial [Rhodoplanes sp.]
GRAREFSGRHAAFQNDHVEALEIPAGNPETFRHHAAENDAEPARFPDRGFEFLKPLIACGHGRD